MRYRAGVLRYATVASLLRYAPVASFAPAHVALRAAFGRQCWFALPRDVSPFGLLMQPTAQPPCCLVPNQRPLACVLRYATVASLLRYAAVAHPGLHICLSLGICAIARVFAPAQLALRANLRLVYLQLPRACDSRPFPKVSILSTAPLRAPRVSA
jgi:hypothetical protein